jgi:regulator of replication initiation timing
MATKDHKKPTTLDDLAAMMNQGFTETQQHMDGQLDALREEMSGMQGAMQDMLEELTATHADVRHIRSTVDMLVKSDAAQDAAITDLTARVTRLEKKVGLTN